MKVSASLCDQSGAKIAPPCPTQDSLTPEETKRSGISNDQDVNAIEARAKKRQSQVCKATLVATGSLAFKKEREREKQGEGSEKPSGRSEPEPERSRQRLGSPWR